MLGSYRLLLLVKLILFELLGLKCIEDDSFRRYRRLRSPTYSHTHNSSVNPLFYLMSASISDHFAVINCSTPEHVPHHKLDWYFQTSTSSKPPRVIWQRGRSNIHRYIAYSPDQLRHFLQIKPILYNDSGTYTCLDQTTGFFAGVDLIVHDSHNCAESIIIDLHMSSFICLILFLLVLLRYTASESQVP
ncbi:unnamed protein product [Rotaria socialis]|uniref:Ig-like domain-containing protein n=1 Tax=Rotaria socialis TaxID=392032 RepID=A0A818AE89_9BILA|nr:unnamed protein product [Rotaria socialis]CAF3403256.1 unnamed protein product [Rotaria socialis]CAF3408566.1 unnamed protein product [Rotaria socialis]CAF3515925.1 unnamed protein product [Rotaria socialis]CAF3713347.1 unnamed protein product [Rotaria socialis]